MDDSAIKLPDDPTASLVADTFKLISDPTRLKILYLLCHSEQCVNNVAAVLEMSPPAVAHHLKVLKSSGLLSSRRDGKEVFYTLAGTRYAETVHATIDTVFGSKCSVCASARTGIKCRCEKNDNEPRNYKEKEKK